MNLLNIISFAVSIVAYTISQLAQHGKLRWSSGKNSYGFWGAHSDKRKYKYSDTGEKSPAFFLSTTLLVFITDGYHMCQALMFLFLSLGISLALRLEFWQDYLYVYAGIHAIHFVIYRVLQK